MGRRATWIGPFPHSPPNSILKRSIGGTAHLPELWHGSDGVEPAG